MIKYFSTVKKLSIQLLSVDNDVFWLDIYLKHTLWLIDTILSHGAPWIDNNKKMLWALINN